MRKLDTVVLAAVLVGPACVAAPVTPTRHVQFAFHSGFLMNLHHFLYNLATHSDRLAEFENAHALSPEDSAALRQAAAFYRARYDKRDLLFDEGLAAVKRALRQAGDAVRDPQGLPLPADVAANRAWIRGVMQLDARYGAEVQATIERGLAAQFPATPVRVDLVAETGKRQGAYTDEQAVIPSGRPGYGGLAALEMLYHEGAHVQTTAALEAAIATRLRAAGQPEDSELWHVLQFYTVGRAVAGALARDGIAYQPYADKAGLFAQVWGDFVPLIAADWQPWLDGSESEATALDRMVARLPSRR